MISKNIKGIANMNYSVAVATDARPDII